MAARWNKFMPTRPPSPGMSAPNRGQPLACRAIFSIGMDRERSGASMYFRRAFLFLILLTLAPIARAEDPYTERYRPQFHFSPRKGWIGDPDGLIRYRGEYHLFWWGHATSTDLVHWK